MDPEDRRTLTESALSFGQITNLLRTTLANMEPGASVWVREVWDSQVVYDVEPRTEGVVVKSATYRRSYSITDEGKLTLGDAEAVRQQTTYVRVAESTGHPALLEAVGFGSDGSPRAPQWSAASLEHGYLFRRSLPRRPHPQRDPGFDAPVRRAYNPGSGRTA